MKNETYKLIVKSFELKKDLLQLYPQADMALIAFSFAMEEAIELTPENTIALLLNNSNNLKSIDEIFPNIAFEDRSDEQFRIGNFQSFFCNSDFSYGFQFLRIGAIKKEVKTFKVEIDDGIIEVEDEEAHCWNGLCDNPQELMNAFAFRLHSFLIQMLSDRSTERFSKSIPYNAGKAGKAKADKAPKRDREEALEALQSAYERIQSSPFEDGKIYKKDLLNTSEWKDWFNGKTYKYDWIEERLKELREKNNLTFDTGRMSALHEAESENLH